MRWEAVGLAAMALGQGGNAPIVEAKDGARTTASKHRVELLGVCDLTSSGATCWKASGQVDAALQSRVIELFKDPSTVDVGYRRGAKNRFLVLNVSKGTSYTTTSTTRSSVDVATKDTVTLYRLILDPDVRKFDAFVQIDNATELPPAKLPFVTGQTLVYHGFRIEIGKIEEARPGDYAPYGYGALPANSWRVFLAEGRPDGAPQSLRYEALDAKGEPIRWVDAKGKKVSEKAYRATLVESQMEGFKVSSKGYSEARFGASYAWGMPGAGSLFTNIDPSGIESLRVQGWSPERVRFANLSADPAGGNER